MGFEPINIPSSSEGKLIFTPEMIGSHTINATYVYNFEGKAESLDASIAINITGPNLRSTEIETKEEKHLFLYSSDKKFLKV